MRRVILACAASLLLYGVVFGCVLDRPLTLGFIRQQIDAKLARAAAIDRPKLVILAGSNGPYSHRCEVIEAILAMPCVNGGVAVGIGLDYLFARWRPLLRPGDVVYLPMEEEQYTRSRMATALGPDAAIMFRHDRRTLGKLPADRWLAALFSYDLRVALMSVIELALVAGGFHDPRPDVTGDTNAWGDHIGHTAELAEISRSVLATVEPHHATAAQIRAGYGSALIADFVRWASEHGIRAIGGPPTEFADSPMPDGTQQAIRSIYLAGGGLYLKVPGSGRYPRIAFFDTADHLNEPWQIWHSFVVAGALGRRLNQPVSSAGASRYLHAKLDERR